MRKEQSVALVLTQGDSKLTELLIYTVIFIASLAYSFILLSQFTTQVASNTITWSWATFYEFSIFALASITFGFFSLAEFNKLFGRERSNALSMILLVLKVLMWVIVIVELVGIAAVATVLELWG
jgi:hypothetical protein